VRRWWRSETVRAGIEAVTNLVGLIFEIWK
jgi:hypothetical protein